MNRSILEGFFTAEDFVFKNNFGNAVKMVAQASADRANQLLREWLLEQRKVYGSRTLAGGQAVDDWMRWNQHAYSHAEKEAYLVEIRERGK